MILVDTLVRIVYHNLRLPIKFDTHGKERKNIVFWENNGGERY